MAQLSIFDKQRHRENVKITTTAFSDIRVEETLEEVIEAINKALEV